MPSRFIKKILSLTLCLQMSVSPVVFAAYPEVEAEIQRRTPDRQIPYTAFDNTQFYEYYLTGLGHNCPFAAFRSTREKSIDLIEQQINAGCERVAHLLNKAMETDCANPDIAALLAQTPSLDEKRRIYLNHYRTTTTMVECYQNVGPASRLNTISLLDVLACVYKVNVRVHIPNAPTLDGSEKRLTLFHTSNMNFSSSVHLILHHSHYNRLLRVTDPISFQNTALQEEEKHLEALRTSLEAEARQTEAFLQNRVRRSYPKPGSQIVFGSPTSQKSLSQQTNTLQDDPSDLPDLASASRDNQGAESSSDERPQRPSTHKHVRVTPQELVSFLHKRTSSIANFNTQKTRSLIWDLARRIKARANDQSPVSLARSKNLIRVATYKSALFLDHGYIPPHKTRSETINEIVDDLKNARDHAKILGSSYKVVRHHMRIYLGRVLIAARKYDEAWDLLSSSLTRRYSKAGALEMAKLILENGYRPQNTDGRSPEEYAFSLLNISSGGRSSSKHSSSGGEPQVSLSMLYPHTPYVNSKESQRTRSYLLDQIHTSYEERGLSFDFNTQKLSSSSQRNKTSVPVLSSSSSSSTSTSANSSPVKRIRVIADQARTPKDTLDTRPLRKQRVISTEPQQMSDDLSEMFDFSRPSASFLNTDLSSSTSLDHSYGPFEPQSLEETTDHTFSPSTENGNASLEKESDEEEVDTFINLFNKEHQYQLNTDFLLLQASAASRNHRTDLCLDFLKKAYAQANAPQKNACLARILLILGHAKFTGIFLGKSYGTFECYRESYAISKALDDKLRTAQALIGLGNARYEGALEDGGKLHNSVACYKEAYFLAKEVGDNATVALALIGLGHTRYEGSLDKTEDLYNSQRFYKEAYILAKGRAIKAIAARALIGLGNVRFRGYIEHTYYTTSDCYLDALGIAQMSHNQKLMTQAYLGLGNCELAARNDQKALEYFNNAKTYAQMISDPILQQKARDGVYKTIKRINKNRHQNRKSD